MRCLRGAAMRRFGKWLGRVLLVILVAVVALWAFAPRQSVDARIAFDATALPEGLDAWLATREGVFTDITPGAQKQIIWAATKGAKTPLAVVYLHGVHGFCNGTADVGHCALFMWFG